MAGQAALVFLLLASVCADGLLAHLRQYFEGARPSPGNFRKAYVSTIPRQGPHVQLRSCGDNSCLLLWVRTRKHTAICDRLPVSLVSAQLEEKQLFGMLLPRNTADSLSVAFA